MDILDAKCSLRVYPEHHPRLSPRSDSSLTYAYQSAFAVTWKMEATLDIHHASEDLPPSVSLRLAAEKMDGSESMTSAVLEMHQALRG